jgi:uncharacterized protein (TIRG00374 family)
VTRRAIQIAVSIALLILLLWWADTGELFARLLSIKIEAAVGALLLLLVQNDLTTRRWSTAIGVFVPPPRYLRILQIQYMALFAQLFLPSSIGSAAVRAGMLVRGGLSVGIAVNSVVLDRLIAFMGLALLAVCFMPIATISLSVEKSGTVLNVSILTAAAIIVALLVALRVKTFAEWIAFFKSTPLRTFVEPLECAVPQMVRPRFLLSAFLFSLCGQFAAIGAIFILARGSGMQVALLDCILIMPPVMLISALPISVAGWGVREGAMVIAFGLLGVPHEPALILSIQFAVVGYLAAAPGAIAWYLEADRIALGRFFENADVKQGR